MKWLGFASPIATSGLKHRDNGVCIVDEERILFALSEERLSRLKHDHGFNFSIRAALTFLQGANGNLRAYGVSSCSDPPWSEKSVPPEVSSLPSYLLPSHHYSHALSAYLLSGFSSAMIMVADAGGNTFSNISSSTWWTFPREQTSLWMGHEGCIYLLERLHYLPFDVGFGEWYRAFTHYLGWPSHTLSGNVMALAAYGDSNAISEDNLWDIVGISGRKFIQNHPEKPLDMVSSFLNYIGCNDILTRTPYIQASHSDIHANLAAYIQRSLEEKILEYLKYTSKIYGALEICLTGGVFQNCVLNAKIAQEFGTERVYASPFAGDVGQCVGNALFARSHDVQAAIEPLDDTFLGLEYSKKDIKNAIDAANLSSDVEEIDDLCSRAAAGLEAGQVIAMFGGRSEFGPRALGNRSVLGDPKNESVVSRIKSAVKKREDFMPLAPAIHPSLAVELKAHIPVSSSMVFAPVVPDHYRSNFGSSLHIDNTARIQVAEEGTALFLVLDKFMARTGRRVLINTSFNKRGAPIVESPSDAISAFLELDIDALIIGSYWISK